MDRASVLMLEHVSNMSASPSGADSTSRRFGSPSSADGTPMRLRCGADGRSLVIRNRTASSVVGRARGAEKLRASRDVREISC
jgi:hypothetical protein